MNPDRRTIGVDQHGQRRQSTGFFGEDKVMVGRSVVVIVVLALRFVPPFHRPSHRGGRNIVIQILQIALLQALQQRFERRCGQARVEAHVQMDQRRIAPQTARQRLGVLVSQAPVVQDQHLETAGFLDQVVQIVGWQSKRRQRRGVVVVVVVDVDVVVVDFGIGFFELQGLHGRGQLQSLQMGNGCQSLQQRCQGGDCWFGTVAVVVFGFGSVARSSWTILRVQWQGLVIVVAVIIIVIGIADQEQFQQMHVSKSWMLGQGLAPSLQFLGRRQSQRAPDNERFEVPGSRQTLGQGRDRKGQGRGGGRRHFQPGQLGQISQVRHQLVQFGRFLQGPQLLLADNEFGNVLSLWWWWWLCEGG
mmetsp:Transcript_8175/g.17366  ORF Transcript_8175/g.17366 Transcript_8175/m.17366 type:complete len:360 (+) Transcript_8175:372-1451(+)